MRFLQLDPIRAPARAADLVLRQRVEGYRAGDLDRAYPALDLAEDCLHVYGVMPHAARDLLHPRSASLRFRVEREHPRLAARILAHVERNGEVHPRDLATLGRHRTVNGWGGGSAATTRVLEALHFRGRLRVARRVNGIKMYALAPPPPARRSVRQRADALLRLLLGLYAPLPEPSLRQLARMLTEHSVPAAVKARALAAMLAEAERTTVDGVAWLGVARERDPPIEDRVRFLAPFDPIVWDRRRFALLWDWEYRLEAYTPAHRRKLGYYALPLLWRDDVVGWVNAMLHDDTLAVEAGYAKQAPRDASFGRELAAEADRLRESVGAARVELRTIR